MKMVTYRQALAKSMRRALETNPSAIVYGLGVTDFTGIFGTTLGLKDTFGEERVFDTPLSEEAMTGFAAGAALNGIYPIHIHIRMDFMLLAMNQLINSIAKYKYMYGGRFSVPMLIRAVVGRSWGQGAQHSQSLQALFAHIPGLTVIMPGSAGSVLACYSYAVNKYKAPVISIEHRLLYDCSFDAKAEIPKGNPLTSFRVRSGGDVTIVATSIMVVEALKAANFASKHGGVEAEIIDLNCVTHPDTELILKSVRKTGRLIIADSGWAPYGVCAEICRVVATKEPRALKAPVTELAWANSPCPTSKPLENMFYPDVRDIVRAIFKIIPGKRKPDEKYFAAEFAGKYFNGFKGPF